MQYIAWGTGRRGHTEERFSYLKELIESEKHMILELAQTGELMNAANL